MIKAHSTISNDFLADLDLPGIKFRDLEKPILVLDKNYSIRSPNSDTMDEYRRSLPERVDTYHENSIICYTDGSSTEEGVGGGYLTTTKNINSEIIKEYSFKLPGRGDGNQGRGDGNQGRSHRHA